MGFKSAFKGLKTLNGIFSACDRFMLKIFFCGVKRM
jgi:hypothetical protein